MAKVIVLAGGFATRLRPLTLTRPKPLLPILDKPLLDWIIDGLRDSGLEDIILSLRYLSHLIKERYGSGIDYGVNIRYVEEHRPLGDAGPIKLVKEEVGLDETFLVVYGDIFSNIDYKRLLEFHKKKGGLVTIVLTRVEDPSRYGVAVLDEENRITGFVEKPEPGRAPSNVINAGVYVFEPEVVDYIPEKTPSKLAKHVIPRLVAEGEVYGFVHEGLWSDIGVPADYYRANIEALRYFHPKGYVSNNAEINSDAVIEHPSFISDHVRIGKGSKIGPYTILGRETVIGENVRVRGSIFFQNVMVENSAVIRSSIVGERCFIGKWARLEEGSIIGDEVVLDEEVLIARRVIILPFKEVNTSIYEEGRVIL